MSRLDDKTNNEILLGIKQLQVEYDNLKVNMVKDYDSIELLKEKMKKDWLRLEQIEVLFSDSNDVIMKRLKGSV